MKAPIPDRLRAAAVRFAGSCLVALAAAVSLAGAEERAADPLDWTNWRGPEQNGISRETGIVDSFDPEGGAGSNLLWRRAELGSRSTPIVMNGKLYVLTRAEPFSTREGERVVCADPQTGETIWENRFNVWSSDVPDTRVAWSSVVGDAETGRVYALGVCGLFQCIDGTTGKTVWSYPLHEAFGLLSTYGGRTNVPVLCDDLVLISGVVIGWGEMARPAHRFLAFDKATGEVVWFNGTRPLPDDTTYSTPNVTVLGGQKALVFGSGDGGIWAFQPRTGVANWQYRFSRRGINTSPVVVGDTVYVAQSEENLVGTAMGAMGAINGLAKGGDISQSGRLWHVEELMVGKSTPLYLDGRLYCVDDSAKIFVLDAKTGELIGRRQSLGTIMRASLLYADGKMYAFESNGRWFVLAPDEQDGVKITARGRFPAGEEIHASPIVSHGKLYVNTTGAMYCFEDKSKQHGSTPRPAAPEESPVSDDPKPAHVQVVPAEVLLKPGESRKFTARLFNSRGQLLGGQEATFSLEGPGQIGSDGTFVAAADSAHVAAIVKARIGDLEGQARIRIIPPLPWKFDFERIPIDPARQAGEPYITWVGARYRHVVREVDGNKVMVKITTIPKGMRSRCWFGHTDLADYTIQADVMGDLSNEKMPDIGLIAQGYTLDIQGVQQKMQIRAWDAQLEQRMGKTIEFAWKPQTWYTMKMSVSNEGGKAVVRGKAWPRGTAEPAGWTIEAVDHVPTTTGSPGLFGNATLAEIFLDNIEVRPSNDATTP